MLPSLHPMNHHRCSRRAFLRSGISAVALAPFAGSLSPLAFATEAAESTTRGPQTGKVAIVPCKNYGPAVRQAYDQAFDLLGGIGPLVRGKTCTIKLNLTGTNFTNFKDRPV